MPSIVDIHPHVISPDTKRYPLNPLGGTQSTWSRDRPTPYEALVAAMDDAGVAKAAIVQASTAYGHDNSYVADAIAAYPKRFTGVFSVDVLAADAVEKMKFWLGKGFSGIRLFTTGSTMPGQATWFDDPRSFPAWEYAGKAGIPVCMQMTPQGFPQLRGLLDRFKDVRVILDHLARPKLVDGPPYAADQEFLDLAQNNERVPEAHATQCFACGLGQGDAEDVLPHADRPVRRGSHRLGFEFPGDQRQPRRNSRQGAVGARRCQRRRTRLDFRRHGPAALSLLEGLISST